MDMIGRCGVDAVPGDLVERTLQRVNEARQRERFARQVESLGGRPGLKFWWSEVAAVAAVVVVGASLLWPALDRVRADARRMACASNLSTAGVALGQYAADFDNTMPRGSIKQGGVWWNVGQQQDRKGRFQSNSAHLYRLVRMRYCDFETLRCPDNPGHVNCNYSRHDWPSAAAVSYSYQNQHTEHLLRLDLLPNMAILADKNPMFVAKPDGKQGLAYREDLSPKSATVFHGGRGQNILTSSGEVLWQVDPVGPNGDNIWLIRGVREYSGTEAPVQKGDSFLVP